jgi:nucleoside-diphosphate-sugar epimerase
MLEGKTILVTGITGFVGSRLANRLVTTGVKVRGLVRAKADLPAVQQFLGDITDQPSLLPAVQGSDMIVHCAASDQGINFKEEAKVNVEGTRHLVEAALQSGCERFVHVSTCGAYNLVDVDLVDENTPLWDYDESSPLVYGVTKAEAERVVMAAVEQGLPAVVLRPPNILGAHPRSFFAKEMAVRIRDGDLKVYDQGSNTWPYVHIENFLDAIEAALVNPIAVGRAYTIVDGHTTFGEFCGRYAQWFNVQLGERPAQLPYDLFKGKFSTKRAKQELGYSPRITYEEAMQETFHYLQEIGLLAGEGGSPNP